MFELNSKFTFTLVTVFMCFASQADADLIINLTQASGNDIRIQAVGELHPIIGNDFGGSQSSSQDRREVGLITQTPDGVAQPSRIPRISMSSIDGGVDYGPIGSGGRAAREIAFNGNGAPSNFFVFASANDFSPEFFSFSQAAFETNEFTGVARITSYDSGGNPASIVNFDEDFVLQGSLGFSDLLPGTYTWGDVGGSLGDGITVTVSAVPEPNAFTAFAIVAACLSTKRKRRLG